MPIQRLREVRAVGNAYASSVPDTVHVISTERDWMRGDIIVAEFDSVAANDTTTRPQPRRIVATGNATSYHQLAADTRVRTLPNINYVRGKAITVLLANREVTRVEVFEQASGVYVEPFAAGAPPTPAASVTPPANGRRNPAPATVPPKPIRRDQ
jgi:hypothetical protein